MKGSLQQPEKSIFFKAAISKFVIVFIPRENNLRKV